MLTLVPGGMGGSETYAQALTRELAGSTDVNATAAIRWTRIAERLNITARRPPALTPRGVSFACQFGNPWLRIRYFPLKPPGFRRSVPSRADVGASLAGSRLAPASLQ